MITIIFTMAIKIVNIIVTQRNLIKPNRNQIVFNIFGLIWKQADFHLIPNQSENDKYNLCPNKSKTFICRNDKIYNKQILKLTRKTLQ